MLYENPSRYNTRLCYLIRSQPSVEGLWKMEKPSRERQWLQTLQPRGIIFGFSLGLLVLTCVHDYHLRTLYSHSAFAGNAENQVATFWLVIASLGLLLRRWWSHLIAIVVSGKTVYSPGYLSLWIYSNVSMTDGSLWSFATWKGWYYFTLATQPQYILHAIVGAIICSYASIAVTRQLVRSNRTRANEALQLTAR
jgi:hypothetical protein